MDIALRQAIKKLRNVSVATVATALFKRGLRHQVIQGVHPVQYNYLHVNYLAWWTHLGQNRPVHWLSRQ